MYKYSKFSFMQFVSFENYFSWSNCKVFVPINSFHCYNQYHSFRVLKIIMIFHNHLSGGQSKYQSKFYLVYNKNVELIRIIPTLTCNCHVDLVYFVSSCNISRFCWELYILIFFFFVINKYKIFYLYIVDDFGKCH